MQYCNGNRYACTYLQRTQGAPVCQHLPADPIDARVVDAFFEAIAPAELDAWEQAQAARHDAAGVLDHAEAQQVERLRYQAGCWLSVSSIGSILTTGLVAAELEQRGMALAQPAPGRGGAGNTPPALAKTPTKLAQSDRDGAQRLLRACPTVARTLAPAQRDPGAQERRCCAA